MLPRQWPSFTCNYTLACLPEARSFTFCDRARRLVGKVVCTRSTFKHKLTFVSVCTLTPACVCAVRGVGPGCNTREIADKLIDLKAELDDLAVREHELDQQRVWVQQSIKNVTDDSDNSPYPFLRVI